MTRTHVTPPPCSQRRYVAQAFTSRHPRADIPRTVSVALIRDFGIRLPGEEATIPPKTPARKGARLK
jgi:hypothetical protein